MNTKLESAPDSIDLRYERRGRSLQFLQLITKTFVSLSLYEKSAIADTLNSMVATHLEVREAYLLLRNQQSERLEVVARQGSLEPDALLGEEALSVWSSVFDAMIPTRLDSEQVQKAWPSVPEVLSHNLVAVPIDVREAPVGLLVVAGDEPFSEEDLEFLSSVVGIGAMALTNAEAIQVQQGLLHSVEQKALEARRETAEKERALADLDLKLEIIKRQRSAIQELSTPVLQLWDGVLAMPIIGIVDSQRSAEITERLLSEVSRQQARFAILDITGVEVVDTKTADHFIKVIRAAELLGATCIVTGVRPAVSHTLVQLGVDLSSIVTLRNLEDGLKECLRRSAA